MHHHGSPHNPTLLLNPNEPEADTAKISQAKLGLPSDSACIDVRVWTYGAVECTIYLASREPAGNMGKLAPCLSQIERGAGGLWDSEKLRRICLYPRTLKPMLGGRSSSHIYFSFKLRRPVRVHKTCFKGSGRVEPMRSDCRRGSIS